MYVDPKAYQKDPEWIKLDKSARRWRIALYTVAVTIWTTYITVFILSFFV